MSSFNQKRSLHFHTLQHGIFSLPLLILVLSLLSLQLPSVEAQQPPPPENQYPYARFSPSMAIIIVVLIAALFFMGFFSVYIRHCTQGTSTGNSIRQTLSMRRRTAATRGLDASVIETFPTFTYAEVKDHKIGKGALECAVCLNEFEDDETLRLIPKCDHVFHPECIDAWLESHVTCPVCRANLAPEPGVEPPEVPVVAAANDQSNEQTEANNPPRNDEVSIHVECDESQQQQEQGEEEQQEARPEVVTRSGSLNRPQRSWSIKRPRMFGKFRSHSTGHSLVSHSLVVPGENLDRFTLRLPEEVRKEVMTRALLNRTGSCAGRLPREGSTRRGSRTGGGDGSTRGARFYRRIDVPDRAAKSDRWTFSIAPQFFSRALSIKSPKVVDNGEGSTSKSVKTAVRMPSFKCLEPKSADETGLVRSDSARPPV